MGFRPGRQGIVRKNLLLNQADLHINSDKCTGLVSGVTVLTALSSTTLSGYVDTSAQWNLGTGNANNPPYSFGGAGKADGFNLNVVQLSLDRPLDESEWAAGYHVDLWMGPDANALETQSINSLGGADFAIRQAYVA